MLTREQTGRTRLPADELKAWAWCTEPEATGKLSALLSRRIVAAVRARAEQLSAYPENGFFVA